MLTISGHTLAFIVAKARQFEAEAPAVDPASGSNPTDDGGVDVLEAADGNPTAAELRGALVDLNDDEKDELLALVLLGRGDFTRDEWPAALAQARDERGRGDTVKLMEMPMLSEYIETALAELEIPLLEEDERRTP